MTREMIPETDYDHPVGLVKATSLPAIPTDDSGGHDPRKLQTGLFLQQFTNSVSRALYKERCAHKGYTFVNDGLIHGTTTQGSFAQSHHKTSQPSALHVADFFLPSIDKLNHLQEQLVTNQRCVRRTSQRDRVTLDKPQRSTQDSCKGIQNVGTNKIPRSSFRRDHHDHGTFDALSKSTPETSKGLRKSANTIKGLGGSNSDLRLPKIMNIRDVKGNTWEIQEDPNHPDLGTLRLPSRESQRIFAGTNNQHINQMHKVHIKRRNSKEHQSAFSHDVRTKSMSSSRRLQHENDHVIFVEANRSEATVPPTASDMSFDTRDSSELIFPTIAFPSFADNAHEHESIEPSCGLPPVNTTRPCTNDFDLVYHDEFEKQKLLQTLHSEAKRRKTPYNIYVRQLSEVQFCSCQRERLKEMKRENRGTESLRRYSEVSATSSSGDKSEHRAIYTRQGMTPLNSFPPELEALYNRSNLTVLTMAYNSPIRLQEDFSHLHGSDDEDQESSMRPYLKTRGKSRRRRRSKTKSPVPLSTEEQKRSIFYLNGIKMDKDISRVAKTGVSSCKDSPKLSTMDARVSKVSGSTHVKPSTSRTTQECLVSKASSESLEQDQEATKATVLDPSSEKSKSNSNKVNENTQEPVSKANILDPLFEKDSESNSSNIGLGETYQESVAMKASVSADPLFEKDSESSSSNTTFSATMQEAAIMKAKVLNPLFEKNESNSSRTSFSTTKQESVIKAKIFDPLFDRTESNSSRTSFSSETKSYGSQRHRKSRQRRTRDSVEKHRNPVITSNNDVVITTNLKSNEYKPSIQLIDFQNLYTNAEPYSVEAVPGVSPEARQSKITDKSCRCGGDHNDVKLAVTNVVFKSPIAL